MFHSIEIYILLFFTYAILGWLMEVGCKLVETKKFINRGFLIGPYCPIYGWGAIIITLLLNKYLADPIALFIMAIVICSIIEYATSYFMEKIYHARWWDYSRRKYNINGRICLETMIPFGILGVLIMYFTNPFFTGIYEKIPENALTVICSFLVIVFLIDNIISSHIISTIKVEGIKAEKDNTKEITEKVKQILQSKSFLHKRLINAFPDIKNIRGKLKLKIEEKRRND